jgi:DNA ligase 1
MGLWAGNFSVDLPTNSAILRPRERNRTMQTAADVITALEGTNSRLDKERIVQEAWTAGILEFFEGSKLAFDSLVTFNVKKVPLADVLSMEADPDVLAYTWKDFRQLAKELETRELTGHAARDAILDAAKSCNTHTWNNWYRRVLLKDFRCGLSETTINKVLGKIGGKATNYLVPVFTCQLAKDSDDHPNDMRGKKLLDIKLDGARLLTVLNKETGTVTQHSRNGHPNENFPQLTEALAQILPQLKESLVLDGEVVSENFQSLMRQFKRKKNVDTSDAFLALFDVVPLAAFLKGEHKVSQRERHAELLQLEPVIRAATDDRVYVVPKLEVDLDTDEGQAQLSEFNRDALAKGLEGVMIKNPDASYQCKRSVAWLKAKPFIFVDLEVTDVVPGAPGTKYEHTMGAVEFGGEDQGRQISVSVGSGWSDEDRDVIWKHRRQAKGRIGEIRADAVTKSQNGYTWSLRFPRFERWRGWVPGEKI